MLIIIIFYPERRRNSLLVNSSCIVLPYLPFFSFFPHALLKEYECNEYEDPGEIPE